MKYRLSFTALGCGLAACAFAASAAADVAPPPDFVETCTTDNYEKGGIQECVSCSTYYAEPDACKNEWEAQGYARQCQTNGASTWSEVWCHLRAADGAGGNGGGSSADAQTPVATEAQPQDTNAADTASPTSSSSPTTTTTEPATATTPATPSTTEGDSGGDGGCQAAPNSGATPAWLALLLGLVLAGLQRGRLRHT